jgi:hypothetical protein
MKFINSILATLLMTTALSAQQVDWLASSAVSWHYNPVGSQHTLASAPGYLVAMRSVHTGIGSNTGSLGTVALERIEPASGITIWSCLIGNDVSLVAAAVDGNGIAYFSGHFRGEYLELCDGTMMPFIPDLDNKNAFLIAWDLNAGELLWTMNIKAEIDGWYKLGALAIDPLGALWFAMSNVSEGLIVRVDAAGGVEETRVITNCRGIGGLSFDPWGGMYVSGLANSSGFSFGGSTTPDGAFHSAMFVLRYRPDGSAGFVEFANHFGSQLPRVTATKEGHAYLAGNGESQASWGDFELTFPLMGPAIFLAKLDSTGTFQWLVESVTSGGGFLETGGTNCIAVDGSNNVYFTGTLRGVVDWGNGVVSDGITTTARTITVVAFDPSGLPLWARTSDPGEFAWAQAITASAESQAIHFISHITSEFTYGVHTTNIGDTQASVVGRITELSTSIDRREEPSGPLVWPNPVADALYLEFGNRDAISTDLFNSAGQRVQSVLLQPGRNTVMMNGLAKGLYLLRLADGQTVHVVKE